MVVRQGSKTGITMKGAKRLGDRFIVNWVRRAKVVSSSEATQTVIDDAVFDISNSTTVDFEADAVLGAIDAGSLDGEIEFSISDPQVASIDDLGRVTRISDGYIRIIATNERGYVAISQLIYIYRQENIAHQSFSSWVAGSLAGTLSDLVDAAIAEGEVSTLLPMYVGGNTRNSQCWAAPLADLSCIDREKPGSGLIAQQFALQAGHFPDSSDTYVAMDGDVQVRSVVDSRRVGPLIEGGREIRVVKYDSPLPSKFVPALLPSPRLAKLFGNLSIGVPALSTDQEKKALISDLYILSDSSSWMSFKTPSDPRRALFFEGKVGGDSGSPHFLIIPYEAVTYNNRLMIITALTSGGAGSGPNYSIYIDDIVDAIVEMGGSADDIEIAELLDYPYYGEYEDLVSSFDAVRMFRLRDSAGIELVSGTSLPYTGNVTTTATPIHHTNENLAGVFDGNGSYATASIARDTTLRSTSLSAWFRWDGHISAGTPGTIVSINPSNNSNPHLELGVNATGAVRAASSGIAASDGTSFVAAQVVSSAVGTGEWHHAVAITTPFNTNQIRCMLYLDGVFIGQQTTAASIGYQATSTATLIGSQKTNSNRWFNGAIANVDEFDYVLTEDQITALYISGPIN